MSDEENILKTQARRGRFTITIDDTSKSFIAAVQNELKVKLVSSAELSSKVNSESVLKVDKGILYKNIDIAVVDQMDLEQMLHYSKMTGSKILHWEEDRIFTTANRPLEQLNKVKEEMQRLQDEILILEVLLDEHERKSNGTFYKQTWGLDTMNIAQSKYTGKGVNVCILDTGFYAAHPDFQGRNIEGENFIEKRRVAI